MLKANRSKDHQIKETEKDFYHVLIIRKEHDPVKNDMIINKSISIFDGKGYDQFKKNVPAGITEVELLHDPKLQRENELKAAKELDAKQKSAKIAEEKKANAKK